MRHWTPAPDTKTPSELLADIKTVDGASSGLDADLLDGTSSADFTTLAVLQSLSFQNEVMGFPALVGKDIDLDASNQWWDKIGTPATAVFMTDVAGEAGITESYEYALETTTDGSGEGFYQRYTYADQPRIKSGLALSAMAAVWVGTAGSTVTMSLTTSASTEVTATATAQAWTIVKCENLTLDGTYVDLKFTIDAADTFYVVPLGVNLGTKALKLPERQLTRIQKTGASLLVTLSGKGDEITWTDVDATSSSSNITACADLLVVLGEGGDQFKAYLRRNGDTTVVGYGALRACAGNYHYWASNESTLILDDSQTFEYYLDREAGAGTLQDGYIYLTAYWEWQ